MGDQQVLGIDRERLTLAIKADDGPGIGAANRLLGNGLSCDSRESGNNQVAEQWISEQQSDSRMVG